MDRATIVHENFLRRVAAGDMPQGAAPRGPLGREAAVRLYRSGCLTRALDLASRRMQAAGEGCIATITMPNVHPLIAPMVYAVPVQLLAYHVAVAKGTDVDQPRNLAKSVTVE